MVWFEAVGGCNVVVGMTGSPGLGLEEIGVCVLKERGHFLTKILTVS